MIRLVALLLLAGCPYVGPGASDRFYDRDGDGVPWPDDCDDADAAAGLPITTFADRDGDGFGDPATATQDCAPHADAVTVGGDCDDGDDAIYPHATEICGDGVDQDCDGADLPCPP